MPNFIEDDIALGAVKTDKTALGGAEDPTKNVVAADWNEHRTALADINIDTELARYIGAPAGAVAYKVGELIIIELRSRAEQALGERFDIRAFHDLILAQGQLPMTLLEQKVDGWIAQQQSPL